MKCFEEEKEEERTTFVALVSCVRCNTVAGNRVTGHSVLNN